MQVYRRHSLNYYKISHELNEASCQSQDLWREIYDCEKELPELQASNSAAVGTWRCQERLSELRVRNEDAKRRESALEKSQKKEIASMDSLGGSVTTVIEDAFEEANLLPHLPTPPHSYTDSEPSPSVERPITYMYEELPLRSTDESSSKIFEGDIEDGAQFPSLSTAALRGPEEISGVAVMASRTAEQQKRSSTASSDFRDKKPPSDLTEAGRGEEEGADEEAPRQHEISRAYRQSLRMYELAISRRDDPDGKRQELYRQQYERRVQSGKELPWSHSLTLATPEIVLTTPERLRRPPSDSEEDSEEDREDFQS